ncbi:MAG: T9SS type A sorting domain-containing protein, partial [Candidatus Cloacimonetes bacterium]|nr:T9SS type A sorting domain-containing protein [Candidatus Cloacimonadota bacterium]
EINDPDWENAVCGQRFYGDFKVYVLGFPMYYMNQNSASQIVDLVLQDFGEVTDSQNNIIHNTSVLLSNYPNPFNPSTTISFELNAEITEDTKLVIYNLKGQKVRVLECVIRDDTNARDSRSTFSITWDGTDQNNQKVSSGIYFYQLRSNDKPIAANKMILIKTNS